MINVIPYPSEITKKQGYFLMPETVRVSTENDSLFKMISDILSKRYNTVKSFDKPDLSVVSDPSLPAEGYVLDIEEDGVTIAAASDAGVLYAMTTLRQLIGLDLPRPLQCECMRIKDAPLYPYRGMMLDLSRHFFDKTAIKSVIDMLAYHKMNKLHLHLTDDNGWRIEIKKYPLLTEIGSKRNGSHIGSWNFPIYDETPYSGYLSQSDIKELVAYASRLNIDIIPEIDMPAHFRAAIAAYPHLACREEKRPVPWYYATPQAIPDSAKNYARIACAGKESTFEFIFDIIDELTQLFPSEYFHIGGDEVAKLEWSKCADCAATIKREGLAGYAALQGYFTNRVIAMLKKHGKTPILWNEALDSDMLDPDAVVQYWAMGRQPAERVCRAVREEGRKIIMSRCDPYYLDYPCGMHSLKSVYGFEPCLEEFGEEAKAAVVGVECPLWTEHVADEKRLFFMFYPRAIAVAESGWSTPEKDYEDFERRLCAVVPMLAQYGVEGEPVAECNPGRLKSLAQASSFGMKMQRRADITSARNWRSMHMK